MSLWWVWQEAGVHVLQVWPAGADGGDAESVAAVSTSSLVRSVVRVVEGLGMRACAGAGLRQLPAGQETIKWSRHLSQSFRFKQTVTIRSKTDLMCPEAHMWGHPVQLPLSDQHILGPGFDRQSLTRSSVSWCLRSSWLWVCCWPTPTEARSHRTDCSCSRRRET